MKMLRGLYGVPRLEPMTAYYTICVLYSLYAVQPPWYLLNTCFVNRLFKKHVQCTKIFQDVMFLHKRAYLISGVFDLVGCFVKANELFEIKRIPFHKMNLCFCCLDFNVPTEMFTQLQGWEFSRIQHCTISNGCDLNGLFCGKEERYIFQSAASLLDDDENVPQ